jgi:hypothetical protein
MQTKVMATTRSAIIKKMKDNEQGEKSMSNSHSILSANNDNLEEALRDLGPFSITSSSIRQKFLRKRILHDDDNAVTVQELLPLLEPAKCEPQDATALTFATLY